ncbi:hypothetical protein FO519_004951 [Halicephalobus sp. NKZ332]|nr:hypothetical protein FO519_004951 [Halicephalobus sp. NKZ332]
MKKILFFSFGAILATVVMTNAIFDNLVEITPPEDLKYLMTSNAAMGVCPDEVLIKKANYDWETYLGFNGDLTWKNSSTLWVNVRQMLKTGNLTAFQKVCRSRDLFYGIFGQALYYQCINIFSLMQYTTDWAVAATYVRMWSHLDFMCNVGYEQLISPGVWNCMVANGTSTACDDAYQQNVNYTNPCPTVQRYMDCKKGYLDGVCGKPNGYYACEDTRLGYGSFCENLRCTVMKK